MIEKKKSKIPVILPSSCKETVGLKHGGELELLELNDKEFNKLHCKIKKKKEKG